MRAHGTLITLLLFSLLSSSFSFNLKTRYADGNIVQLINSTMDWTANPCDDFFEFSCGGWAKNTTLSPSQSIKYLYNDIIVENNKAFINEVVNDPNHVHVHPFYVACMDLDRINAAGITPVSSLWEAINEVNDPTSFSAFLAHLHTIGFPSLFQWIVDIDPNNPPTMILQFQQGGLALPDRSLYSDNDIITAYAQHITNMMVLFGESQEVASGIAQDVIKFETALASITVPNNNLTDPFSLYNPMDTTQLKSLCPSFDWNTYLTSLSGNSTYGVVNLITPTFFSGLNQILYQTPTTTLISYLRWCVAHSSATLLTEKISDENFAFFGKIVAGLGAPPPRNSTCIGAVDGDLGDLLGVYYARLAFSEKGKSIAREMVVEIEQAMRNRLNGLTWMDDVTRSRALTKLSLIANYIGYPDHLRNISFPVSDDYFSNVIMSNVLTSRRSVVQIGLDADRSIWSMTADTVNAYYDPTRNEMVFPAAILQWPFFDLTIPPEVNYGGTGFTMGHELTHGFDNSGRDYDGQGRLVDWWQASTGKEFSDRVQCVIDQYSTFEVLPGVHIDGKLTQGENVADMGGIKNAYDAYLARYPDRSGQPSEIQGLNNNQLFFVAFAQGWCAVARPEYLRTQVKVDPHSWAKFRVLGTLMNFPEFSQVFQCPVGSVMNPTKRCVVW